MAKIIEKIKNFFKSKKAETKSGQEPQPKQGEAKTEKTEEKK